MRVARAVRDSCAQVNLGCGYGMKKTFIAAALAAGLPLVASAQQQSEVLISTLPTADLMKQITATVGTVEHKSEAARGGPVAVVVRTAGCTKDTATACKISADVVIYGPDGAIFHQVKGLDVAAGRAAVPLKLDVSARTGIYKVVLTIRDLTARRFETVERQFGVK
jgi:hypothetical protein